MYFFLLKDLKNKEKNIGRRAAIFANKGASGMKQVKILCIVFIKISSK